MKRPFILLTLCLLLSACGANQATPTPTAAEIQPVSNEITQSESAPINTTATAAAATPSPVPLTYTVSLDNFVNPQTGALGNSLSDNWEQGKHTINVCTDNRDALTGTYLSGAAGELHPDSFTAGPGVNQYCDVYNNANVFGDVDPNGLVNLMDPNGNVFMTIKYNWMAAGSDPTTPGGNGGGGGPSGGINGGGDGGE
ncbi:MAG: hypothetical protein HYZ24_11475 [Chloroflexi bacterium]|nr:hypothetical protein [Chloroflexota bacterium]